MDFREEFIENKLNNLSNEVALMSKQLLLFQDFIVFEFGSKFKNFCESRRGGYQVQKCSSSTGNSSSQPLPMRGSSISRGSNVVGNPDSLDEPRGPSTKTGASISPSTNLRGSRYRNVSENSDASKSTHSKSSRETACRPVEGRVPPAPLDEEGGGLINDSEDSSGFEIDSVFIKCEERDTSEIEEVSIDVPEDHEELSGDSFSLEGFNYSANQMDCTTEHNSDRKRPYTKKRSSSDPDAIIKRVKTQGDVTNSEATKYECSICKKVFYWTPQNKANGTKSHMRTHDATPPTFSCTVEGCNRVYAHVTGLHRHLRNNHQPDLK